MGGLIVHRWNCAKCDKKWFLRTNTDLDYDKKRLANFEISVSLHVANTGHEVTHKQQEEISRKWIG